MILTKIYQTLEDRDNADYIEANGPFPCDRNDAWIGEGCYFWEDDLGWAHKWGRDSYGEKYVICQSSYDKDNKNYYDLSEEKSKAEIFELKKKLQNRKNDKDVTLAHIIAYLRKSKDFKYKAIRFEYLTYDTIKVSSKNNAYLYRMNVVSIQICVLKKTFLINGKFEIIHPSEYISRS